LNGFTSRPAPLGVRLYFYWQNLPPGRGVSLMEMVTAMGTTDPQAIRSSLTRLRKGGVPNPASMSADDRYLAPLPVRWNSRDRKYYDLSRVTGEVIAAQVPGNVMSSAIAQLLTRAATLRGSMDGFAQSARTLLSDPETTQLLLQIRFEEIWRVQDYLVEIGRARQLLELQRGPTLPSGEPQTNQENGDLDSTADADYSDQDVQSEED
jgi:hypothetical protein